MEYEDEHGRKYEISYSQKLQLRIVWLLVVNGIVQFLTFMVLLYALLFEGFVK